MKLCNVCGQPILRKGQKRKHPDDYRHAQGCPLDDKVVELYQSVWITFSDGTRAGYLGQAKALPSDTRTISNIEFTEPKPMPANCHFERLDEPQS